jgi:Cu/Ag efflux protein CusF
MNCRLVRAAVLAIPITCFHSAGEAVPVVGAFGPRPPCVIWRAQVETNAVGVFHGVGVITAIQASTGALTLNHDEIKGLMPAMEMMYRVKSLGVSKGLTVGDRIGFDVDAKTYTILRVERLGRAK